MDCLSGVSLLKYADFSRKVLLLGDIKLDVNKTCTCSKIAAEAPIPVNYESGTTYSVNGAPTVARYLHGMGIDTDLVAVKGTSDTIVQQCLEDEKFGTDHVISLDGYYTEVTTRYFTNGCQTFQSVKPSDLRHALEIEDHLLKKFTDLITKNRYALVFVMFSPDSVATKGFVEAVVKLTDTFKTPTVFRCNGREFGKFAGASVLIADKTAALEYGRVKDETCKDDAQVMETLHKTLRIRETLILLSETDMSFYQTEKVDKKPVTFLMPRSIHMNKLVAVGNAINAAIVFGRTCELDIKQTCALAIHCVENVCKQSNEISLNLTEILPSKVISSKDELINFMNVLPKNKKVVVTTGCFDLLHANHIDFLRMSKEQGDILIILLNSDMSVKELKGPTRPIYPLEERVCLLQAVQYVDFIVPYDENVPRWHLETIDPDVLAKGDEYTEEEIMKDYPFLKQCKLFQSARKISTTKYIQKIKLC